MKTPSKWLENAISKIRNHDLEISKNETAILEILLQIESRKEYADAGFDGLYSFCIKTFGWSETQTSIRTQAMYAMRVVPQIREKIDSGSMSVTTVAQVQRYIRQEQTDAGLKRTAEEVLQVFESFENKTSVQVKEELALRKGERIKLKLSFELDEEAEKLWHEVRNLSAHQTQGSALNCLKILMKEFVEQKQKVRQSQKQSSFSTKTASSQSHAPQTIKITPPQSHAPQTIKITPPQSHAPQATKTTSPHQTTLSQNHSSVSGITPARRTTSLLTKVDSSKRDRSSSIKSTPLPAANPPSSIQVKRSSSIGPNHAATLTHHSTPRVRFIPADVRRQIFARDLSQCKNCGSKHALQIDHIQPVARGGTNESGNLRILCRNCNLRKAFLDFPEEETKIISRLR